MSRGRSGAAEFYGRQVMGSHDVAPPVIHMAQVDMLSNVKFSSRPRRLLDIGSGAGVGAQLIAESAGIQHVTCVDISSGALAAVVARGFSGVVASAEGEVLPFENASFDVVVIDEVIEHLVDTDSILDEIHRVLTPDGVLLLSTPNLAAWFNRLALLGGLQPAFSEVSFRGVYGRPGIGIVGHLRLFTRRALHQFVAARGFSVELSRGVPFPELPGALRPIDRMISRFPSLAGGLVILARPSAATPSD